MHVKNEKRCNLTIGLCLVVSSIAAATAQPVKMKAQPN